MLVLSALFCAAIAIQIAFASPIRARTPYSVKERHYVPREWTRRTRAPGYHMIHMHIGLKQSSFDELERHLYEVSDPDHDRYGQHLSVDEVNDLVRPSNETLDMVHEWLTLNGVKVLNYSPSKDWIDIKIDVNSAERLLDTEYYVFKHKDGSRIPTTSFFRSVPQKSNYLELPEWYDLDYTPPTNATIKSVCNISRVTPECFMTLYSTKDYKVKSAGVNQIGFNSFLGEIPIRPDTKKFLSRYRPAAISAAEEYKQISINHGPTQNGPLTPAELANKISHEANLDVQTILGISWPTPVKAYSTGGCPPFIPDAATPNDTNEPYLDWVTYVSRQHSLPQVISTSYGDDEQTVPPSYAIRVCQQFAQLGARGVSLLFSSGDDGVGDTGACYTNDGKNKSTFLPSFPASCPYVTTVGATHEFEPEVVAYLPPFTTPNGEKVNAYASGSGFSNYFARPSHQDQPVLSYVKGLKGKYGGLYNKSGRAYPDLAAQGQYFATVWNGTFGTISGTSAATPLTAGIISLLNDARIAAGAGTLGFLNPWLYSRGYKGLRDVVSGSAIGCGVAGFPARKGWDAVTGFGTPSFPELLELALNVLPK